MPDQQIINQNRENAIELFNILNGGTQFSMRVGKLLGGVDLIAERKMNEMPAFQKEMIFYCKMAETEIGEVHMHQSNWAEMIVFDSGNADLFLNGSQRPMNKSILEKDIDKAIQSGEILSAGKAANLIFMTFRMYAEDPSNSNIVTLERFQQALKEGSSWAVPQELKSASPKAYLAKAMYVSNPAVEHEVLQIYEFFKNDYNILSVELKVLWSRSETIAKRRMGDIPPFERGMLCFHQMMKIECPEFFEKGLLTDLQLEMFAIDMGRAEYSIASDDPDEYRASKGVFQRLIEMGKLISPQKISLIILDHMQHFHDADKYRVKKTFELFNKELASGSSWVRPSGGREMSF